MIIERKKNAARNIVWGFINKSVAIAFPFIARTIVINKLGAGYLGIDSLFTSVLKILNLAELGFGSALVFSMYKPIAEDDKDIICALLNVYRKIYRVIGSIILITGMGLLPFVKYIIKGEYPTELNIYAVYLVYLLNTAVSYFAFAYRASLLSAHNRNDIISKVSSAVMAVQYIVQILILYCLSDYYMYIMMLPVFTFVSTIIQAFFTMKMYPDYVCKGDISGEMRTDIRKRVCGLASYKIYGVVFSSVDAIVISAFLGVVPLAIYNNYYYIAVAISGFLAIMTNSLTASIGNSLVLESVEKNYRDFKLLVFMNMWLVGWCAICMTVLFQPFIDLWIGQGYWLPIPTVFLIIFMFYASLGTRVTFLYKEALGLWWEDRLRPLAATIVNLFVNILLVRIIGLNGVIISTVICTLFINIPWGSHVIFNKYFKQGESSYYVSILKYSMVNLCVAGLTYYCAFFIDKFGIIEPAGIALKAVICLIVPNLCFIAVYHRKWEYKETREMLFSFLRKCFV